MKTLRRTCLAALLALLVSAMGAPAVAVAADATPSSFLARIAGVYKHRFQNALVTGEQYQSENILEVVPVDDHTAYIRLHLEFANGHSGAIYGIATADGDTLTYDNRLQGRDHCVLRLTWSGTMVSSSADYTRTPGCRNYHGARGTLNGRQFQVAARRNIRYMQRLKDSTEFRAAMDEYGRSR